MRKDFLSIDDIKLEIISSMNILSYYIITGFISAVVCSIIIIGLLCYKEFYVSWFIMIPLIISLLVAIPSLVLYNKLFTIERTLKEKSKI